MKKSLQILMLVAVFSVIGGYSHAQVDPPCVPVTDVETSDITSHSAKVTAKTGLPDKEIITQSVGDLNSGYGQTSYWGNYSITVVHRYTPDELAAYDGGYLTKISFIPTATVSYTLVVYTGGSYSNRTGYNHGTRATTQVVPQNEIVSNQWNEITLNNPIKINAAQELWIGYGVTASSGTRSAGYDAGPEKAGKGNLIYSSSRWRELTALSRNLTYNWCIKGTLVKKDIVLELGEYGFTPGTGEKNTISQLQDVDTTLTHTYSGLMMNTTYDYYIQKQCFGADTLVGPFTFTTLNDNDWCTESFEDYEVDSLITKEANDNDNGACWRTWTPNVADEDGTVTDEQAFHGNKAGKFVWGNDMVFLLGEKTEGSYVVDFRMYVPEGIGGYFSILHYMTSTSIVEEGCEITITANASSGTLKQRNITTNFSFPKDQWVPVRFDINLEKDSILMTVNYQVVKKWRFSDISTTTTTGTKQLYGINFFPNADNSVFYVDAINMSQPGLGANPLTIDSVQDLIDFRTAVNSTTGSYKGVPVFSSVGHGFAGKHFVITTDLDLSSVCGEGIGNWEPIGNSADYAFRGTLDGQGHSITNLYINNPTQDNQGLFGFVVDATIANLNLENGFINGGDNVGGLCGNLLGNATIESITNGMNVEGNRHVGGIVGIAVGNCIPDGGGGYTWGNSIYYVTNTGTIIARSEENGVVGGIVGTADTTSFSSVVNSGLISSPNYTGGIIGHARSNYCILWELINTGMILSPGEYQAAIIGYNEIGGGTVSDCFYDKQIYPGTEDDAIEGKLTSEMVGTGLQEHLGYSNAWIFKDSLYPSLARTANSNVSKLAAAPFFLQTDGVNYETVDSVISNIRLDTNVTWHCSDTIITISDTEAVVHCVPADTRCSLTASLAGNEKVYRLTNRKVGPTTSLNIELCANQLPYQHDGIDIYRDTTLIYPSSLGCDSSVVITLTVHQLPDIMIVGNPTPCYGSDVILIAQSADTNDTYLWSTSATDTTDTLRLTALTMDTTISIIVSNDHDGEVTCIAYDTIKLVLLPVYSHHDTITICSAQLPYTYGNTYVAFTEEGDQEPVILQAANGCDSTVHVYMYVYDDTRINDTVEICANELPLAYYDSIFAVGTVTGDYEVHVQNSTGCDTVYLLRLTVNPVPTATLTPTEAVIFVSENIQLIAITEDNLQWSTGETNDTITVTPTAPGINTYYLSLSNEHGCVDTLYSNIYLETCGAGYPVVDIENNSYETHIYGSSCWMVENLRSTVYSDGQPIPGVMEYSSSVYPDAAHNVSIFGRLYDWYSATRTVPGQIPDASLIQGVCPDGWRLPTYNEYLELMGTLGYSLVDLRSTNHWLDDAGNNSSHFDMRPAGYYDAAANQFMNLHGNTYFITITTILEEITTFETFSCGYNCPDLLRYIGNKTNGYSVRCVKNFGQRNGQSISG